MSKGRTHRKKLQHSADGIDMVDVRHLKNNHAEEMGRNFATTYVIQHKRYPDKVAEIKAASFVHACTLIGWRPRQARLLEERGAAPDKTAVEDCDER